MTANGARQSYSLGLNIKITGNNVTITDSDGDKVKGSMNGKALTATGTVVLGNVGDGIFCTDVVLTHKGTLNGTKITGTLGGNNKCSGPRGTVAIKTSGTFNVSENGAARQSVSGTIGATVSFRALVQ